MIHSWSKRSLANLDVHPDLRKVADRALHLLDNTPYDFIVTDGGRTLEEQRHYVAIGASQTMHSRHLGGFALDFVAMENRRVTYDIHAMTIVADAFKEAAEELRIPIEWGGDWHGFKDTPHIQLSERRYPDVA